MGANMNVATSDGPTTLSVWLAGAGRCHAGIRAVLPDSPASPLPSHIAGKWPLASCIRRCSRVLLPYLKSHSLVPVQFFVNPTAIESSIMTRGKAGVTSMHQETAVARDLPTRTPSHAQTHIHAPRRTGLSRYASTARQLAIVLQLVAAGKDGLTREELLAAPALSGLLARAPQQGDALRQAIDRDLRHLTGGQKLRALKHPLPSASKPTMPPADDPVAITPPVAYDPATARYRLAAPLPTLRLSDAALAALGLLAHAYHGDESTIPGLRAFFAEVLDALPADRRAVFAQQMRVADGKAPVLTLDGPLPGESVDQETMELLDRAANQRRLIEFTYAPRRLQGNQKRHTNDQVFGIELGEHPYVFIWCDDAQRELWLRLDRIVPGSVRLTPTVGSRQPRLGLRISYRLAPGLAVSISQRLVEQEIVPQADGSAIVHGRARPLLGAASAAGLRRERSGARPTTIRRRDAPYRRTHGTDVWDRRRH